MHVKWRASRQIGSCAVELKLERLPVRNGETPSQGQGTGKVKAFESQQNKTCGGLQFGRPSARHQKRKEILSRRASRSASKESQVLPVERALQPSALYRCGSRSEPSGGARTVRRNR